MDTFRRSLRALGHPLSLAAIGLLLLNDHVLKAAYPSWLTGKLSDFAGLFFFPFILIAIAALPVALLRGGRRAHALLPLLAFALVAAWFAAIKLWPPANAATTQLVGWLTGGIVFFAPDPTDVLALAALVPAWWLWRRVERNGLAAGKVSSPLDWRGLSALAFAAVATMATSPCQEPPVVRQVTVVHGSVYLAAIFPYRSSLQYLLIQEPYSPITVDTENIFADHLVKTISYPLIACDPTNQQSCYRIGPPDQVEESRDHGATWQISWRVPEDRHTYIERYALSSSCLGPASLDAGPYDLAFVERADGMEVVVAMGGQGLLVRTGDGEWHRRSILGATPIPWAGGGPLLTLVETLITLGLEWLILLAQAAVAAKPQLKLQRWVAAAVITWAGIAMILWLMLFPSDVLSLEPLISFLLGWPVLLGGLVFGLAQIADVFGVRRAWQCLAAMSLVTVSSTLGFYAWSEGYIARYEVAAGLAIVASLAIIWLSARGIGGWQKRISPLG